jgi:hypothetical protein
MSKDEVRLYKILENKKINFIYKILNYYYKINNKDTQWRCVGLLDR